MSHISAWDTLVLETTAALGGVATETKIANTLRQRRSYEVSAGALRRALQRLETSGAIRSRDIVQKRGPKEVTVRWWAVQEETA